MSTVSEFDRMYFSLLDETLAKASTVAEVANVVRGPLRVMTTDPAGLSVPFLCSFLKRFLSACERVEPNPKPVWMLGL